MSSDDSSPRVGSTRRLIGSLRNVLFESTPQTPAALVSATVALRNEGTDSDVEAARQVLRSSVEAELGPGVREFALQNQALLEILPDPALRRKAALRVLSLKGTSPLHLSIELDQALATLSAQGEAFAHKVQERRAALEAGQRSCSEQYQQQTADAEQAMARLRAELDAHGVALTEALSERDRTLAESEASLSELSRRERGFQCAFHDLENEYQSFKAELAKESL